ncbi:EAL domain-containing protein [Mariprofundus ferrooxydans]|uniref:sensor domain-containing protein n=1 Tax=Mariprofundus ferrooxydans TaxID=314344 RepID=UPI000368CD86|nr:EAL domain-containing protein [Mariprofundus ferrooxydans]
MPNSRSTVSTLFRYSWLYILLIGLLINFGSYRHMQNMNEKIIGNAIALHSQVKTDAIRAELQQHLDTTQAIIAFIHGELDARTRIKKEEVGTFFRALLDIHSTELNAVSLIPPPAMGEPLSIRQNDTTVTTPLPQASQLRQIAAGDSTSWQIEQIADHTILRIIIATGMADHRAYVVSDWSLQALFETAISNTPIAGLNINIEMLRNHRQQHLFTHASRMGSGRKQPGLEQYAWHGGFDLSGARFMINAEPVPELIEQFPDNMAHWTLTLGLLTTLLLMLLLFNRSRVDEQLQKELSQRTGELSAERHKLAAVIDHALESILVTDEEGRILLANPASNELFGYDAQTWQELSVLKLLMDHNASSTSQHNWFSEQAGNHSSTGAVREMQGRHRDGSMFPCEVAVHAFTAANKRRCSIVVRDMTELTRRQWVQTTLLKLRTTSQARSPLHTRLKQILEDMLMDPWHASAQAGAIFTARGKQQWLTASFGWSAAEKKKHITVPVNQCLCGNTPGSCAESLCIPIKHNNSPLGLLHLQLQPESPAPQEFLRFCQQAAEIISEMLLREHIRQALEESENKHRQLVETTPMGIVIYSNNKICYINPAAVTMLGASGAGEILGQAVLSFIVPDDREAASADLHTLQQGGYVQPTEERFQRLDGSTFWGELRGVPVEYESQPAVQLLIQDISSRKEAQEQLRLLSYSDELTGLPNRRLYSDRVEQACSMARRRKRPISLLFLDLDRFKLINDTRGHACGDMVLKTVANRLLQTLRVSDTAARMGGDEFAVLLPETEPDKALRVAGKLIAALNQPILIGNQELIIGASIGLASFPADGEDGETLLKHADSAMYYAKQNRLNIHCFSSVMEAVAQRRMQLEDSLRLAAGSGQLSLHYQSQHSLAEGTITGMESLMRWHHPELGNISPGEFIPLAEETGLIRSITAWAITEASRQALVWEEAGIRPERISINISAAELMQQNLASEILTLIRGSGAKPEWIEIEITETAAMNQPETGIGIMRELVEGGVSIAIDDFGTGYSSLAYLKQLPANHLKIDIAFIRNLPDDTEDAVIVRTIIAMAHALGMTVIAEGVETQAQLDFLRQEGCDGIQGYLLGKPLPADEASTMLANSNLAV